MSIVKETKRRPTKNRQSSSASTDKPVEFNPSLNGIQRIKFDKANSGAGFKVLLQGGMFHRLSEGYVVTNRHVDLLRKAGIPFDFLKT